MFTATDGTTYRISDAHTHIYAPEIAERAAQAVEAFYRGEARARAVPTADVLCANGTAAGVENFLVCSVATKPHQVSTINRFIAAECAKHPEFVGMGAMHPDCPDFEAVLEEAEIYGFKGIKLHPDIQEFYIDDPRMLDFYRCAAERGLVCMFHVGDPQRDFSAPERLARVLDKVPNMLCHAAHFGCCLIWKRRPLALAGADSMFDTSSMMAWASVEETLYLVEQLGVDKLMWGTDFPLCTHEDEQQRLLALGLSQEDNQKIFYDNFARFYGLPS